MLASELGTDVSNARKLLREIESLGFAIRVEDGAGSYYFINPHCYCAGDVEEEKSAKRKWEALWLLANPVSPPDEKSDELLICQVAGATGFEERALVQASFI